MPDLGNDDDDAIWLDASQENDPSHWPRQIAKCTRRAAQIREGLTIQKKMEKPMLLRMTRKIRDANKGLSKAEAYEEAQLSEEYAEYIATLAKMEADYLLWDGRARAVKAQHEASRTYAVDRRAALYGR